VSKSIIEVAFYLPFYILTRDYPSDSIGLAVEDNKSPLQQLWLFSTLAFELGIIMAGMVYIGYLIDNWLLTSPWFTIIFLFLGIGAGANRLAFFIKRFYSWKQ
jgi:hypothetical protein